MFRAKCGACPEFVWERCSWNVGSSVHERTDDLLSDEYIGLAWHFFLLVVCLYSFPWTTIMDESGVGDFHTPSISVVRFN